MESIGVTPTEGRGELRNGEISGKKKGAVAEAKLQGGEAARAGPAISDRKH